MNQESSQNWYLFHLSEMFADLWTWKRVVAFAEAWGLQAADLNILKNSSYFCKSKKIKNA